MKSQEFVLKTNVLVFASRSKAKTKSRRPTSASSSTRTLLICDRCWTFERGTYSTIAYSLSKRMTSILRHGPLPREEDGAIEFRWVKDYLRNDLERSQHWSDKKWKSKLAKGRGKRKDFNTVLVRQDKKLFISKLFKVIQDAIPLILHYRDHVLNPNDFFEYIYHIGCAISLHLIMNSGLISGGQNLSKRQTVFFTSVDPMNKEHKDPYKLDLTQPRLASYKKKKWRRHQDTVYRVDIQLAQRKGLKFYQRRCNAIILYDTLPACCISKVVVMESWEIIYEKVCVSPRPPPTISFKDNWMKELDSKVAWGGKDPQQTQPKTKDPIVRTGRPVLSEQQSGSSVQEIENVSCLAAKAPTWARGDLFSICVPVSVDRSDQDKDADENVDADHVRTERPVESEQSIDLFTQREDIDIDFRVSGLPHAVVKHAENFRVRELVKKIESHPHRRALQADVKQNNAYNPFTPTNPTKMKNKIVKNGETREWATIRFVHSGDRKRCLVWSRRHQKLKNGETCGWTTIQPELCARVCWTCRQRVHSARGNWHWLQSTRIVTLSCKGSRTSPSSRPCKKDRSTSSRLAAE